MEPVLVLDAAYRSALSAVRDQPDWLAAAAADGALWLRGPAATSPLPLSIRQLPARAAYWVDAQGRLFPVGGRTPTGQLPVLYWEPIAEFMPLEVPIAALPGEAPAPGPVQLVPARQFRPGAALLTTLAAWVAYAETAPAVRLTSLRFAVSGRGQVLLLGAPLPPLPGREYWQTGNLLLPAGYELALPLAARLLTDKLQLADAGLLLFDESGQYEVLAQADLHPATRAAVRLTAATFALNA